MDWYNEYDVEKSLAIGKRDAGDVGLDAKDDVDVDHYVQYIHITIFI